jgi:uncharacterized membrane protein (UPF0127 family)
LRGGGAAAYRDQMRLILFYLLLAAAPALVTTPAEPKLERVSVDTAKGAQVFMVEVVREEKERNRGLMFRESMAKDRGMLFDYDPPQEISFWMKNTFIPLDIIFIDVEGKIISIAEKTTPLSLTPLPSGGEARGVLEINGGLSEKLGIKVGDRVHHALFDAAK